MYERAAETLRFLAGVVHRANEKVLKAAGKDVEARVHGLVAEEFEEAAKVLEKKNHGGAEK